MSRWKRARPHLSYRCRVLVINNLLASSLWHRFILPATTGKLVKQSTKATVGLLLGRPHWLRPTIICRPLVEDGQGMVHIRSQIMAVRLCSVKKLLSEEQFPNHLLTSHILQQAVGWDMSVNVFSSCFNVFTHLLSLISIRVY